MLVNNACNGAALRRIQVLSRHLKPAQESCPASLRRQFASTTKTDSLDNFKGKSYPFQFRIPLRWRDHDQMNHTNNSLFFTFFEEGRLQHFEECGFTIDVNDKSEPQPIVSSTYCKFRAPLTYPDTVTVGVRVDDVDATSFTHNYAILSDKTGRVVAEGNAGVVFIDYESGKRGAIPARILEHTKSMQKD